MNLAVKAPQYKAAVGRGGGHEFRHDHEACVGKPAHKRGEVAQSSGCVAQIDVRIENNLHENPSSLVPKGNPVLVGAAAANPDASKS